nr:F-box protein At3g54460-like isoform X2 [Physcomitrium patens]|eukprot:XP_024399030.1 F-box protein At3g54460-like isoform X2 [Physcomitrella patens]
MAEEERGVLSSVWEDQLHEMRLCGFAIVVLKMRSDALREGELSGIVVSADVGGEERSGGRSFSGFAQLVGAECSLQSKGPNMCVRVEQSGLLLWPLEGKDLPVEDARGQSLVSGERTMTESSPVANLGSQRIDGCENETDDTTVDDLASESTQSGAAGSGNCVKRRCGALRSGNGLGEVFLHQLQWVMAKNHARVHGRVLTIAHKGDETRVLAMLDLYLPPSAWMGAVFWKSGAAAAAALSHLSCDWEERRALLMKLSLREEIVMSDNVWEQGGCHVLGCKVHQVLSKSMKAQFDLHSLFKSLPSYKTDDRPDGLKLLRDETVEGQQSGLWDVPDEIITSILNRLLPKDLHNVAAVCRYTRLMAVPIIPCMHLRLFPHQQAAVRWMLQRENRPGVLEHPLCKKLETEDGFPFYLDTVSGELSPEKPPEVHDFRGGLFCDEPGLGKTVTALSLILKTQGMTADAPANTEVFWVPQRPGERMGYYEVNASSSLLGGSALKRSMCLKARRNEDYGYEIGSSSRRRLSSEFVAFSDFSAKDVPTPSLLPAPEVDRGQKSRPGSATESSLLDSSVAASRSTSLSREKSTSLPAQTNCVSTRSSIRVKRKLGESFELASRGNLSGGNSGGRKRLRSGRQSLGSETYSVSGSQLVSPIIAEEIIPPSVSKPDQSRSHCALKKGKELIQDWTWLNFTWVQCEACSKWRKLPNGVVPPEGNVAWFCSLNPDSLYQNCTVPQEIEADASVKSLPGFYKDGTIPGQPQNVAFFASVLKTNAHLYDECARRPVIWLASLNPEKSAKLATVGLAIPREARGEGSLGENSSCDTLFKLFGLEQKKQNKGAVKWSYPKGLDGLLFDTKALGEAARKPKDDATRLYLSRATLIVVTQSLVEHWKHQIAKHTAPGQLRVYVWTDHKKPAAAHTLAWDYDIVITTFHRLSSEWSIRENSVLMRIHWLRIMLDEGHTLGASLSLTNKLQMAKSLHASRRWILTGTPTPNTPSSQAAYLRPMLEFLHENIYSKHQKLWDNAILRPFEAGCEEGRFRLVQLLHRTMISSRKADLCTIPPCIRKVTLLNFTEAHAASYNELVVTVQRNILLADWRDPSHVESLLNPKQWKFRSSTLRNTRLSCCVAGHIKVRIVGNDVDETMDLLVADYGLVHASDLYYKIRTALIHGGNCDRCQVWCKLPIVTPCCHLLCMSCVALDNEKCTLFGCGHPYKMQSPAELARPENPTPKWPVPQDLIELQPSYAQDDWDPDWHATSSSKVAYLVNQLKVIQDNNLMQHYPSDTTSKTMPDELKSMIWQTSSRNLSTSSLPCKAIVFSQFLEHINVIEEQLNGAGIQHVGIYSPMHSMNKVRE